MSDNALFSAILMTAILLGAGMFIIEPFFRKKAADMYQDDYAETPLHSLLSRKDTIYVGIKDLEFDYSTGKLSEEDFNGLRAKYSMEAAEVLEEIDALTGKGDKKGRKKDRFKCSSCGFTAQEGDKFCQSCGASLS
jgi:lipopolysaccharide biosynthesis regulator YciM